MVCGQFFRLLFLLVGALLVVNVVGQEADFTLQLLHVADQEAGVPALDDVPRFSAVLSALRAEYENTITLGSGDAYIPGVFFSASAEVYGGVGRADIMIQNQLGFQAISLGNHEFDRGTAGLRSLIMAGEDNINTELDESYVGTQFPYLSANLNFSTDPNLADLVVPDDQPPLPNSLSGTTVIMVGEEMIGVVGATTPTLPSISSSGSVTVLPSPFDSIPSADELDELAAVIQGDVDELLAAHPGMNKVILLAHMQRIGIEEMLATRLRHVDIIVAGGSNTLLSDETDPLRAGDIPEGNYPFITVAADGHPIVVVNTDAYYKYVGRLVIGFNENGVIIPNTYDENVSGVYATDEQGVAALNAEGLVDPVIQEIVDSLRATIYEKEKNVFGVSNVFLNGAARQQETNLGNLAADANLAAARAVDSRTVIALVTGGDIRDNIGYAVVPAGSTGDPELLPNEEIPGVKPAGGISQTDVANTLRFNNALVLLNITAFELYEAIEHGLAGVGARSGAFPQVSGMKYSYEPTAAIGSRVRSLVVMTNDGPDVVVQNGALVGESTREFRMVALGFTAAGGDGYSLPARELVSITGEEGSVRTGAATFTNDNSEQDALAEYLAANYGSTVNAFNLADVGETEDERIQNLAVREDTVIPQASASASSTPTAAPSVSRTRNVSRTPLASASRTRVVVPTTTATRRASPSPLPSALGRFTVSFSRTPQVVDISSLESDDSSASHVAFISLTLFLALILF